MTKTIITTLSDPHGFSPDPLTHILRAGARDLIQKAEGLQKPRFFSAAVIQSRH